MSWQVAAWIKYDPLSGGFAYRPGGSPSRCLQPRALPDNIHITRARGAGGRPGGTWMSERTPTAQRPRGQPVDTFSVACGKEPAQGSRSGSTTDLLGSLGQGAQPLCALVLKCLK